MTDFVLATAESDRMLSHMALYGLAAIAEDGGLEEVRLSWTVGMAPRPVLSAPNATPETIGDIVRRHAARNNAPESWLHRRLGDDNQRGLMSPRISVINSDDGWRSLQEQRHDVLERLTDSRALLDLRLIAALGEPSYWSKNRKGDRLQDNGASRLEMQPRNQGSEFVGNRLRPLAAAVAARTVAQISDGLLGRSQRDEIGKDAPDSRTPTGFSAPGPTDNALAWCALWGISQFPIAQRIGDFAQATGHIGRGTAGFFYAPVWYSGWRTARLRTVLASRQLSRFAATGLTAKDLGQSADGDLSRTEADRKWLACRGVASAIRFPVHRFGSDSAPERRAMLGQMIKTGYC